MKSYKNPVVGKIAMASIFTALAGILFFASARFFKASQNVSVDLVVPESTSAGIIAAKSYVTVGGSVAVETISEVYGGSASGNKNYIFTFQNFNNLLVFCPYTKPCAEKLSGMRSSADFPRFGVFAGRIYDFNTYSGSLQPGVPALALSQVAERVGADLAELRVLSLAETPDDAKFSGKIAAAFGLILALFSILLWILTFRKSKATS